MDLSNLSSNLPATKSLEQVSLQEINNDLTDDFKNAAKSVATLYNASAQKMDEPIDGDTERKEGNRDDAKMESRAGLKADFAAAAKAVASLYRNATSSNVTLMHKGYLACLDDLLDVISNGEDIENWALTKRAEITNVSNQKGSLSIPLSKVHPEDSETPDFAFPSDHDFALSPEVASNLHFRPSFPPLSVSFKRSKNRGENFKKRPQSLVPVHDCYSASSEADSDGNETTEGVESKKRRILSCPETDKRRKRDGYKKDSSSDAD